MLTDHPECRSDRDIHLYLLVRRQVRSEDVLLSSLALARRRVYLPQHGKDTLGMGK